jgi:pimeloyl-ACP methyl ester carboxylesterase
VPEVRRRPGFLFLDATRVRPAAPEEGVRAKTEAGRDLLQRVAAIDLPVFVANGDSDPMILPRYSYLWTGLLPNARVKIYPDSAHGFLFQHHSEFAADVNAFVAEAG